ncbi:MAG: serine hydrolase domain-containing protein [Planctomycetaceae bacterium]
MKVGIRSAHMVHRSSFGVKFTVLFGFALGFVSPSIAQEPAVSRINRVDRNGDVTTRASLNPDVLAKLDVALERAVQNHEVSGVIGLIHHNGQRGYFEAFGWQDIEAQQPLPRDAIFRLKSMSKPVITVAALVLFDNGKFALDDPISKHLPEWKEPKVSEGDQLVPARNSITPRMLMTHSSGLYYQLPGKPAFSGMPPRDENTTLEAYSRALASQTLLFHPGKSISTGPVLMC